MHSYLSSYLTCLSQSLTMAGFGDFYSVRRHYPLLMQKACLPICLHFLCPFTLWVSSHPNSSLYVTPLEFHFLSSTVRHCFCIWSGSPTAVHCCGIRSSDNADDWLSIYSLCPIFSILELKLVKVASLLVINGEMWCLSLPEYTVILYIGLLYVTWNHTAFNFYVKRLYFFSVCCLRMNLPVHSTLI